MKEGTQLPSRDISIACSQYVLSVATAMNYQSVRVKGKVAFENLVPYQLHISSVNSAQLLDLPQEHKAKSYTKQCL